MPFTTKWKFEVKYLQIVDEKGKVDTSLIPALKDEELKNLFLWMHIQRLFDEQVVRLQRMGKCGTYASSLGQEACCIGSAYALKKEDVIVPSFREQGTYLARGLPIRHAVMYWGGSEQGSVFPKDGPQMLAPSIPIATHTLHAVGAAMAFKLRKEDSVAMTYLGDGGTSEGDFHEALNFASVFNAPIIFVCQNNQWAISVPRKKQTAAETIAQKAIAYGIEGIQVDGNDIIAVYYAAKYAVDKARQGKGPTLLELHTYRRSDHTTADDATRYRDPAEVKEWEKKDPIDRLRMFLKHKKIWSEAFDKEIQQKAADIAQKEIDAYLNMPAEDPNVMFESLYAKKTPEMERQQKEFNDFLKERAR